MHTLDIYSDVLHVRLALDMLADFLQTSKAPDAEKMEAALFIVEATRATAVMIEQTLDEQQEMST